MKVMIVDDSNTIRQQVNFTLSKDGFQVIEAVDGLDGIAKLKENPDIKVIISDVNMPNMNGLEMVEKMASDGVKIPIVMLTTEGSMEMIDRAKKAGAKGWMVKPFQPPQLIAAVKKLAA